MSTSLKSEKLRFQKSLSSRMVTSHASQGVKFNILIPLIEITDVE